MKVKMKHKHKHKHAKHTKPIYKKLKFLSRKGIFERAKKDFEQTESIYDKYKDSKRTKPRRRLRQTSFIAS